MAQAGEGEWESLEACLAERNEALEALARLVPLLAPDAIPPEQAAILRAAAVQGEELAGRLRQARSELVTQLRASMRQAALARSLAGPAPGGAARLLNCEG